MPRPRRDLPDAAPRRPRLAAWLGVYATLTLLYARCAGRPATLPGFRALSDATYAVYPLHPFFVIPLAEALAPVLGPEVSPAHAVRPGGTSASRATVVVLRRLLGERARWVVGA